MASNRVFAKLSFDRGDGEVKPFRPDPLTTRLRLTLGVKWRFLK